MRSLLSGRRVRNRWLHELVSCRGLKPGRTPSGVVQELTAGMIHQGCQAEFRAYARQMKLVINEANKTASTVLTVAFRREIRL